MLQATSGCALAPGAAGWVRWRRLLAVLLMAAAGSAGAAPPAAPAVLPDAEVFYAQPRYERVLLSPGGSRLALTALTSNGRVGLFVIDLRAPELRPVPVTVFSDADIFDPPWLGEDQLLFSTRDLKAGLGEDYRSAPGLFVVRHDGKDLSPLVDSFGRGGITEGGRIRTLDWNHVLLHVPVSGENPGDPPPQEIIVGELVGRLGELERVTPKWFHLQHRRTRSVEMPALRCQARNWWFGPTGEVRAAICLDGAEQSLHWLQAARDGQPAQWRELARSPLHQLGLRPVWVGPGETLLVEHPAGEAGEMELAYFDFERNAPGRALVRAPGFDIDARFVADARGERLLGVRLDTDAEQTIWLDEDIKALQARIDAALPGTVNRLSCRRCSQPDAVVLVQAYSDQDPGRVLLWQRSIGTPSGATQAAAADAGRWTLVARRMPGIEPARMAQTDLHRIRARDGRDLPVWVTRSPGKTGPRPAVVLVHGGPWVRGRHWNWQALPQFLASRGWIVIEPEFRGSDGYGREHLQAGFKQWGQAMQDDIADALLWARREGLAGEGACIIGGSYGGYSTLMGLVRHPELYRCGSAWVAVTDPFLFLDGSIWVRDDISRIGRRYSLPQMVGDVTRDREMLLANSPLTQAARITRPLQLVWGSEDQRVPIAHGRRLRSAMQAAGLEPEWVVYEGEAHGWRKPENQLDFARRLERFLARHLESVDGAAATASPPP